MNENTNELATGDPKLVFPTANELFKGFEPASDPVEMPSKTKPPKFFERNEYGLLEGADYKFKEDGSVDWKAMVDPKFLYLNPDMRRRGKLETKYNKRFEEIKPIEDKVDDVDLVISLGGLKALLRLRGYDSVCYTIAESNQGYASVKCSIDFIPNYEFENRPIGYTDCACAHMDNANGFGKSYLLETATNRSFARCIRNFLNINIVSQEELGGTVVEPSSDSPETLALRVLKETMSQYNVTWEKIQAKLVEEKFEGAAELKIVNDLPRYKMFEITERIKKAAEKLEKK